MDGNFYHVAKPKPPNIIFGVSATEAAEMADTWAANSKDSSGRSLRKDGLCLVAGVVSYKNDGEDWEKFRDASVDWLKQKYGERLKSVIEHTDEKHPHIHFYVVPKPGERFESIHDGRRASAEAKKDGKLKGEQNTAYCEAMRAYQDDFSLEVAQKFGMTRIGPARRRLSRDQWKAEQKQASFFANIKAQHKHIRQKIISKTNKEAEQILTNAQKEASKIGNKVADFTKSLLGSFHKPTAEAEKKLQQHKEQEAKRLAEVSQKNQRKIVELDELCKSQRKHIQQLEQREREKEAEEERKKRLEYATQQKNGDTYAVSTPKFKH